MSRDPTRPNGGTADGRETSTVSRRHFVVAAAAAGVGFGTAGAHHVSGGSDPGSGEPEPAVSTAETVESTRTADRPEPEGPGPVLGANLNGRPHRLRDNLELLDASNTEWVRAFVDVRSKLASPVPAEEDPDVVALRRAAREKGCRLVVSLKWDFRANWGDKEPKPIPPAGSAGERELCDGAVRYLRAIGVPLDVVILGNEPMWETLDGDIRVEDPRIVEFTRTVKERLVEDGDHGEPSYLVGAFNRAHDDNTRERHYPDFYREMFDFVREDDDVDGIDLHIHFAELAQAERTLAVARAALPDGTITATEFSPVWRYDRHVDEPIAASAAGERFARDNGLPGDVTAVDYFEYAKRNPRPAQEVADFYAAMPWYNVDHVADMYALFAEHDVGLGTFGFMQGLGMRDEDWTTGWQPFHINFLFQPALIRTDGGIETTAHRHYIEDYRERTGRDES